MKFHNINMVGPFILQKVSSLPTSASDARLVYNENDEKIYYRTTSGWKESGGGLGTLTSFTADQTLETGYLYSVDTSSQPLTGYTISSPTSGDSFSVIDYSGSFSDNPFTIISQGGYTINGTSSMDFSTSNTILSFTFLGNEWKVDEGGLLSQTAAASAVNFDGLDSLTSTETNDLLLVYDSSTLENKKITIEDFLNTLNITDLTSLSSPDTNDELIIYDTSESTNKKISVNEFIGTKVKEEPSEMYLDDTNLGTQEGSAMDVYETIDFKTTEDGSVWFSFEFPDDWSTDADIKMIISYSLDGNDTGKSVRIKTEFWSVISNEAVDETSPNATVTNDISTSTDNIGKYAEYSLTNISNGNIEFGTKSCIFKITRDVSEDTYGGIFQLIGVQLYQ